AVWPAAPGQHDAEAPEQPSMAILSKSVLFAAILALNATGRAQQPTFRAATRLTIVDVTVTGKDGRPIEALTANDFTLTEDGVPQTISLVAFQRVDAVDAATTVQSPTPAPSPPPVPRSVVAPTAQPQIASSPAGDIRYQNRRLLVLYFDLSAMPP